YMDSNLSYNEFITNLSEEYSFENFDISDIKVFDEFSHWICAIDDYLWSKKVNILPLNILRSSKRPIYESDKKRNLIYFGAPGTGKSFNLNKDKNKLLEDFEDNYERVTFHPDYSYANFVGMFKPYPDGDNIVYKYVPGPFMRILKKALENPDKPYLLLIEEINRSNVAAVFGDIFQLLDRDENNESIYPIDSTEDMMLYLQEDKIKLPSNLFIWATMNSADQGVFPMDTAFKRRWDFQYFSINNNEGLIENINVNLNHIKVNWNDLRKAINDELLSYKINEDKLMGPFFAFTEFMDKDIDEETFKDIFKNKIIMYLFEDAAKSKRNDLFSGARKNESYITYSKICEEFDKMGLEIFCDNIKSQFISEDE
ncbi:McrB family protein, partial [Methanobrevibacter sp.]|uniref:McrB family protein n=1 Tax=Methanobrevibacter sp. TaxID=66852 RepID=UPI00388D4FD0